MRFFNCCVLLFSALALLLLQSAQAAPGVEAQGVSPQFTLPDPKLPGKLLLEIHARSGSGNSVDTGFLGSLTGVWARLYQKGVPAAILTAPRAQGSSLNKTVVVTATGGVVLKSLTQPGTKLLADTVVWYASLNKIVATGHVFYREGKSGATMTGPKLIADTKLKSIQILSGHASARL